MELDLATLMDSLDLTSSPILDPKEPANSACKECGLWRKALNPCQEPIIDTREDPELQDAPWVLIVDQGPSYIEDAQNTGVCSDPRRGSRFLAKNLAKAKFRWILDGGVRCYAGRDGSKDASATAKQYSICTGEFLSKVITQYRPKVVMCLGAPALSAVWGQGFSLKAFGPAARKHEAGFWVLALQHPVNQILGYTDLTERYQHAFENAATLAYDVKQDPVTYTIPANRAEAMRIAANLPEEISLDVETNTSDASEDRRTTWHKGTRILVIGIGWRDAAGKYHCLSLLPPLCYDRELLLLVLRCRRVSLHAAKADMQMIWVPTKICIWDVCGNADSGRVTCTLQVSGLRDQSRAGNGLKELLATIFHYPDYSSDVWDDVEAANAMRNALRKQLVAEHTKIRRELKSKKASDMPESIVQSKHYTLTNLEKQISTIKADCGFEAVERNKILQYNAMDVVGTHRLKLEWIPALPDDDRPSALAYRLGMRITEVCTYIERVGIPVSRPHYNALYRTVRHKNAELLSVMVQQPEVQQALLDIEGFRKLFRSSKADPSSQLTVEFLSELINVKSVIFFTALALTTMGPDYVARMERTEPSASYPDGQLRHNWPVLEILSGENPLVKPEDKTRAHWIWTMFYRLRELRDMESRFFDSVVEEFAVDEGPMGLRVHSDYIVCRVEIPGREAGADRGGGASTGRISSRSPNAQNIKKDSIIRYCIRPPKGWVIGEADYSSIEPVVLAAESNCKAWLQVFHRGLDLYRSIANDALKLGISLEGDDAVVKKRLEDGVPKAIRNLAKVSTLARMYGEQPESMAARMGMPVDDAVEFSKGFDRAYPEILNWQNGLWGQAVRGHKIATRFGRYRSFPVTGDRKIDESMRRQLVNFPIQSLASDINLWMAWELHYEFVKRKMYGRIVRMFNIVHDSTALEIHENYWQEVMAIAKGVLEDRSRLPFEFEAPLRTSATVGRDMGLMLDEDSLIDFNGIAITSDMLPDGYSVLIDEKTKKKYAYR